MERKTMSRDPIKCMQKALDTFRERNKVYGDNYHQHGRVMMALFKEGVNLQTIEDYNRFGIVNMMVAKLTRYCQGWPKPHEDSVHDLGVYSFMLQALDNEYQDDNF